MVVQGARPWRGFLYDVGRMFWRLLSYEHDYRSTACVRSRHDLCRRSCKFCGALCLCRCHGTVPAFVHTPVPDA